MIKNTDYMIGERLTLWYLSDILHNNEVTDSSLVWHWLYDSLETDYLTVDKPTLQLEKIFFYICNIYDSGKTIYLRVKKTESMKVGWLILKRVNI